MKTHRTIFLADDDADDCMLFEDALREVCKETELVTASDGVELMDILEKTVPPPPEVIFLDLNMPRKNGVECLKEIRNTTKLKDIPVVIFSTSSLQASIEQVYNEGANIYVKKPGSFPQLKHAIQQVLDTDWNTHRTGMSRDHFFITF